MKRIMILIMTAIGIMFLGGNVQAGLGDGLVAYYPFNGNANDESGNGYDGTVNGATLTTDRFGNADSAYSFDGIDNNIELENTSSYDMFSSFSIVAWVNFTSNSDGQSIISKHQNYIINSYNMATQNGYIVLNTNVQSTSIQTPNTYNDGDWHFVVGIYNGTTSFIYVDGGLMASGNTEYTIGNTENIKIGSDSTLSFFNGTIDDVRIYNRILSDSEIQDLYTNTTSSTKTWYADNDGDGYGDPTVSSTDPVYSQDYVADNTDCDDSDATIHPGATEIAGDGIDQDCNGSDLAGSTQIEQISLLAPSDNKTISFGTSGGKVTFSFSKLADAAKYKLHLYLNDILNDTSFAIPVELIPPGVSSSNPWGGTTSSTPGFSETFIGMVFELALDTATWDVLALYDLKWGVEAYDSAGSLIGSTLEGSVPTKYINILKFIASNSIAMISPTPGEKLNQTGSAPAFKWDAYQGVSTYTIVLAHVGSLGFDNAIIQDNLTLNLFPMSDSTWQTMPTGTWYWTILGYNAMGSLTPSGFTLFDFEIQ